MKFTRLHLAGFKTFCEPTDFLIEPGITGVVGPNGCGKSNLVEAIRWVMGENSSKNMRASGMDDVIFAGSGQRPGRNIAEVRLVLDNADRTAPAAFNDADIIEVARRIERESGSTFRVNGREVRARDVQLLFADASTGSRSPAMVRQGMIGEIIAAKPQARRRILEDAAGIAGLHSRRHEAELRLNAAEENLTRLDDVLKQIETQIDSLKRQARQAARYRNLATDIRRNEALLALIDYRDAIANLASAERKLEADVREVAEATRGQVEAARLQAIAAHDLPPLREAEAAAAGELQKLVLARETLDGEEKRSKTRMAEIERRMTQMNADLQREQALIEDAASVLAKLEEEAGDLVALGFNDAEAEAEARAALASAETALAVSDRALGEAQRVQSDNEARRSALTDGLRDETQRLARFESELATIRTELAHLRAGLGDAGAEDELKAALELAIEAVNAAEEQMLEAEAVHAEAREAETAIRAPLAAAEREAQQLETEANTLAKLLSSGTGGLWPAVVDEIGVAKGYEAALGAALGDDLDASTNVSAPAHWAQLNADGDPALPPGVEPLAQLVSAPPALARRLAQIGVVSRSEGAALRALLKPGQRLVSNEGDLWRWDGFTQAAEAPTPAARRLAEKNRLGDLQHEASLARIAANAHKAEAERIQAEVYAGAAAETAVRQAHRQALRDVEIARGRLTDAEKHRVQVAARVSALEETEDRLAASRDEAKDKRNSAEADLSGLVASMDLTAQLEAARARAAQDRATAAEARAALHAHLHESQGRGKRGQAIEADRLSWSARRERAHNQIGELEERLEEAAAEREKLADAPNEFFQLRRTLLNKIEAAEESRKAATDARALAEAKLTDFDRRARASLEQMSAVREEKARSEARLEASRARLEEVARHIASELQCVPAELSSLAGVAVDAELPDSASIAKKLEAAKQDRERLGAVNLRAEDELTEIETTKAKIDAEREDLTEAIRRLRQAIQNLNKEGRERLLTAFDVVNAHFTELFATLFGGGTAELQLVESDDPLEAGLEIVARPPGKKPQVMTLLSGGEQALTALALIFAVFLTNPSPICVLDEVDAPLDDSNVERFCDLLDEMRKKTDTRFMTITHNPITMARMDRLFGVTMAERGVSQLVSVDLVEAERFLEAG
jgi:chromosome segregation protein